MVDGLVISQYDSNTRIGVPRQAWMKENLDQEYWESETRLARTAAGALKEGIGILKEFVCIEPQEVIVTVAKATSCSWQSCIKDV